MHTSSRDDPGANSAPGLDPAIIPDLCARAGDQAAYQRWTEQVRTAGYCQHPVRLAGGVDHVDEVTGEARSVFDTELEPDRVLLKACGTRRAARCAPCAQVYRADAFQLLKAGLSGGKDVPESVASHPKLFVTFTAPSLGPVHSLRTRRGRVQVCRPARPAARCPHGQPARCGLRHLPGDPLVGTPICGDCYDYRRAVVWNALAPELWRRTTIYLRRTLARVAGLTAAECNRLLSPACAKVAEYQARGAIHLHAVIRLDAAPPAEDPGRVAVPPAWADTELLAEAIRQAAAEVAVACPLGGLPLRWGEQLDLHPIRDTRGELTAATVAGYVAKYATKATEGFGAVLDRPIRGLADLNRLDVQVPIHVAKLARAAWALGGRPELAGLGLRRWAHMLGFGATSSRRAAATPPPSGRCGPPAAPGPPSGGTGRAWRSTATGACCRPRAACSSPPGNTRGAAIRPSRTLGWLGR
jgi:hypothetical protein